MAFIAAAILGGAAISGITSLVAGGNAASAATSAAAVQADASKYAADVQSGIYQTTRQDLSPFVRAGTGALSTLSSLIPGGLHLGPASSSPAGAGGGVPAGSVGGGAGGVPQVDVNGNVIGAPQGDGTGGGSAAPPPFQLDPSASTPSPFLNNLMDQIDPNNPRLKQLNDLVGAGPVAANPDLMQAIKGYIPNSGVKGNDLLGAVLGMIPGVAANNPGSGVTENPVLTQLNNLLGTGTGGSDPALIQAALEATPGYQFTRDQGLKSVQNSFAAKGLGRSGAALKGAADYTTGLANNTYEARLGDYLNTYNSQFTNNLNAYDQMFSNTLNTTNTDFTNRLNANNSAIGNTLNSYNSQLTNAGNLYGQQVGVGEDLLHTGANAGAQVGTIGQATGSNIGNNITSGAAATAAGIVGSANATTNALTSIGNNASQSGLALALLNNQTPAAGAGGYANGSYLNNNNPLTGMYT